MRFSLCGVLAVLLTLSACSNGRGPRQIAVTLDDAPLARPLSYPTQWDRQSAVDSIAHAIVSRGVPATAFAIGQDLQHAELASLLSRWIGAGIPVANHSLSHRSFNSLSYREGVHEIAQAQAILSRVAPRSAIQRRFRFPFLESGTSVEVRERWSSALDSLELRAAPVTITTDDWRFDNRYEAAETAQDWDERYRVGQEYLEHVKSSVEYWDRLGQGLYGRNVRHVLMLHANRINRDYLGQILDWLQSEGFEFISAEEAYADRLYSEETSWIGSSGVSILELIKQTRLSEGRYAGP